MMKEHIQFSIVRINAIRKTEVTREKKNQNNFKF